VIEDHDAGDEDEDRPMWKRITLRYGDTLFLFPRSWVEMKIPSLENHDPGDEEAIWIPRNDGSREFIGPHRYYVNIETHIGLGEP
jgi:hypothetical protein